jgi:hypothetical protein
MHVTHTHPSTGRTARLVAYTFSLRSSDFSFGGIVSPYVVCFVPAANPGNEVFSRNGVGSCRTLTGQGDAFFFFMDYVGGVGDNRGGSVVSVDAAPPAPPLSIQVDSVAISWPTVPNQVYQLQYSTDVASTNWQDLGGPVEGTGSNMLYRDPAVAGSPRRVYRVTVTCK